MPGRVDVRRALLSVTDKRGLVPFARALAARGVEIISTGGTARALREGDVPATEVSTLTGFPEILGGRVKTLHPTVHAGILYRRDHPGDVETMKKLSLAGIDLVAVNLYRFEDAVQRPAVEMAAALEEIDIGGPTLLRAAAKNWPHVVVVCDPDAYDRVLAELAEGGVTEELRRQLAARSFLRTSEYDRAIAGHLAAVGSAGGDPGPAARAGAAPVALVNATPNACATAQSAAGPWPPAWRVDGRLRWPLRYGENPHQIGAFYVPSDPGESYALAGFEVLQGKELSYNNLLDLDAGWRLAQALGPGAAVVIKHRNPCGAALAPDLLSAFQAAWSGDSLSAFGGVVTVRGVVGKDLAQAIGANFIEVLAAEDVDDDAREVLSAKKRLTVVTAPGLGGAGAPLPAGMTELRSVAGGWLVQAADRPEAPAEMNWEVVTRRKPTEAESASLRFAWQVVRYVQSNAIVFARQRRTIGVGSGQTSRVDSVKIAILKAQREGHDLRGSVMASDAFFPFPDSVEEAARAGCTAVIQPGGSRRDDESVAAADAAGMAMVLTGRRAFRH